MSVNRDFQQKQIVLPARPDELEALERQFAATRAEYQTARNEADTLRAKGRELRPDEAARLAELDAAVPRLSGIVGHVRVDLTQAQTAYANRVRSALAEDVAAYERALLSAFAQFDSLIEIGARLKRDAIKAGIDLHAPAIEAAPTVHRCLDPVRKLFSSWGARR